MPQEGNCLRADCTSSTLLYSICASTIHFEQHVCKNPLHCTNHKFFDCTYNTFVLYVQYLPEGLFVRIWLTPQALVQYERRAHDAYHMYNT